MEETKYDTNTLSAAIKAAFLELDRELRESLTDRSGTTCTALLITPKHFLFINCGDSRTILSRDKKKGNFWEIQYFSNGQKNLINLCVVDNMIKSSLIQIIRILF